MKENRPNNTIKYIARKLGQTLAVSSLLIAVSSAFSTVEAQLLPKAEAALEKKYSQMIQTNAVIDNQISLLAKVDKQESLVSELLEYAQKFLGRPYRSGSKGPSSFDCSGFTSYVFKQFQYKLNSSSSAQFSQGIPVKKMASVRPGDLVFFKGSNSKRPSIGHVGVISEILPNGQFKFIHASTSKGICEEKSTAAYYQKRFVGVRRIVDPEEL